MLGSPPQRNPPQGGLSRPEPVLSFGLEPLRDRLAARQGDQARKHDAATGLALNGEPADA
jgi:hypothetical protein